jgi:hypothetical protein
MNEERTGKCLQVEHVRGHLWHRYSITVNQVTVATVKLSKWWLQLNSLVEQELHTLPKHLSSPPVFSGVRFTRSLVLYVCFVDRCLSFCTFSFGNCVVCSSSIYGFWLPLWYLQTLLVLQRYFVISFRFHLFHRKYYCASVYSP